MRFLANENFPFPSIEVLRANGFEVASISEDSPGWSDEKVLAQAEREGLVILTFDRDYGELIFRYKLTAPPAVVYFRFKGRDPEEAARILLQKINEDGLSIEGLFTVIEETGVRQRRLK
ncbi:MAG: DUF5615 family PIN-like protein [Saprospiraceae bacterium]